MKLINDIPVYSIELQEDTDGLVMNSIVDYPAVCYDALLFSSERKELKFNVKDKEQQIISGVSILADTPIYRVDDYGNPYYIVFTKDIIRELVERYSKNNQQNLISFQHNGEIIEGFTLIESYFVDKERGICPKEFDVPDGSWITSYKCSDDVWNIIKNSNDLNGFSVEVLSSVKPMQEEEHVEQPMKEDDVELLVDELLSEYEKKNFKRITRDDVSSIMKKNRQVNIQIGERTLENQQIFQIGEDTNGKRSIVVYSPSEKDWNVYSLRDISAIEITEEELVNYDFNAKWKMIVQDKSLGIIETSIGHAENNSFEYAIQNKMFAMIDYYDEENDDGKGFRTCFVGSWGYTTDGEGFPKNETLRVYEFNGASHSGLEGGIGNYRFLLTRRIKDFKIVDYMQPIKTAPIGWVGERQADTGKRGTMSQVIMEAKF